MIQVSIYKNEHGQLIGFRCEGHAGYAQSGMDIICSAVSALVMTTMNAIDTFTSDTFEYDENEANGMIDFKIVSKLSERSELLLGSLILGLQGIEQQYGSKYVTIHTKK